ncbi:hypothetical protein [Onishia taeanensis]
MDEAAKVLSAELGEGVSTADLYDYALNGSLKLSVLLGFHLAERTLKTENRIERLDGFYHIDPESRGFRGLLLNNSIGFENHPFMVGFWVVREVGDEGMSYVLCKYGPEDTYEEDEEPELSKIVVRRDDLESFIDVVNNLGMTAKKKEDSRLNPRRKSSYVKLISMLLAELDLELPEGRYQAAAVLQAMLQQHGEHLSENTLAGIIGEVREAI